MEITIDLDKVFKGFKRQYDLAAKENAYDAEEVIKEYSQFLEICAHYRKDKEESK